MGAIGPVHPLGTALAVVSPAHGAGLGRHHLLGEGPNYFAHDIAAVLLEVLAQQVEHVQAFYDDRTSPLGCGLP